MALSKTRAERRSSWSWARARGEKSCDSAEYQRLKASYLKARIQYFRSRDRGRKSRLSIAQQPLRTESGLPPEDVAFFQKAVDDSEAALAAERKKLEEHEATPPPSTPAN